MRKPKIGQLINLKDAYERFEMRKGKITLMRQVYASFDL